MGNTGKFADMMRMAGIIEDCLNNVERERYGHEVNHVKYQENPKPADSGRTSTPTLTEKLQGLFTPEERVELAAALFGPLFTQEKKVDDTTSDQDVDQDADDVCTCDTCGCDEYDEEPIDEPVDCDGDCALCLAQRSLSEIHELRNELDEVYESLQAARADMAELKGMFKAMMDKIPTPPEKTVACDELVKVKKPRKPRTKKVVEPEEKAAEEPAAEPVKAKKPRAKKADEPAVKTADELMAESVKVKKPRKPRAKKAAE